MKKQPTIYELLISIEKSMTSIEKSMKSMQKENKPKIEYRDANNKQITKEREEAIPKGE